MFSFIYYLVYFLYYYFIMLYVLLFQGGMKAVLWTDTFQIFMMLTGIAAALIQGCIEIGGFSKAWDIAEKNHRVYFTE